MRKIAERFTENKHYLMCEIPAKEAKELVRTYHYSGKVVPNSSLHLGVFDKVTRGLIGALQYGAPMNARRTPQLLVRDAGAGDMYELNRMAMRDDAPKLSESQAIGLSIKYIRRFIPQKKWLLSFSDGKEGNVGTIYQATNWDYYGYNVSDSFYDLDGVIMHNVQVWHKFREGDTSGRTTHEILYEHFDNVSKIESRQHIYIFPLVKNLPVLREKQTYPKRETEPTITRRIYYKKNGIVLPKRKVVEYAIPETNMMEAV